MVEILEAVTTLNTFYRAYLFLELTWIEMRNGRMQIAVDNILLGFINFHDCSFFKKIPKLRKMLIRRCAVESFNFADCSHKILDNVEIKHRKPF